MRSFIAFFLLASTAATAAPLTSPAERAKAEPVQDEHHGIRSDDPYRWMEDGARAADMTAFIRKASDASMAQLGQLPERAGFAATLEQSTRAGVRYSDLRSAGGRLFYRRLDPADRVAKLVVREGAAERILFDPAAGTAEVTAISNYVVSPDGRTVAVHVAKGGAEIGETRFLDVATGTEKGTRLGPIWGEFEVSWLTPDRIAFTRMAATDGPDPMQNMKVAVVPFGAAGEPKLVLGAGVEGSPAIPAVEAPSVSKDSLSPWAIGWSGGARPDVRVFVTRASDLAEGKPRWFEAARFEDEVAGAAVRGDRLYLLTTKNAPNGAIVERALSPTGISAPKTIFSGGDTVLSQLVPTRDGLYVAGHREGLGRLLFLPASGGPAREVKLPFESSVFSLRAGEDGRSVTFGLSGWFKASAFYRAAAGKATPLGLESATWSGASRFSAVREEAVSADGTKVPMVVLLPEGGKRAGGVPTILEGYASYGSLTLSPGYSPYEQAWLAKGGAVALCGGRGGGERGRAWHEGGRSANKPNAHADFIACAERLIGAGYTKPSQLTATGTSAGGLLAPPAALKRPDLFTALIPRVAVLNATRLGAAPNGPNQFAEMGDPSSEAGYKALMAQDPYLMLPAAKDAPDMLITVGLNDKRVAPWFAAKFAARALDRFGDKRAILIRADAEGGHGMGSARDRLIAEWAETYAFAWSQAQGD